MGQFSQYPAATSSDYATATTFLIQNSDGDTLLANLNDLRDNFFCDVQCASLSITSAQVLALNSTPLEIVAAQGAGKAIEVISVSVNIDFTSAAYATNTTLQAITSGATVAQFEENVLGATVSTIKKLAEVTSSSATSTQLLANAALNIQAKTGDPVTGDSDIEVFVLYRILDV